MFKSWRVSEVAGNSLIEALPSPARNYQGTVTPRPGSGKAVAAVVGYSGHVPGKHAENVVGHSFAAANARAAVEESGPGCHTWKRSEAPGAGLLGLVRSVQCQLHYGKNGVFGSLLQLAAPRYTLARTERLDLHLCCFFGFVVMGLTKASQDLGV
eukprot:g13796.t1